MSTKTIEIEGIGKISLTKRKGSKRISMRIRADGLVSVNYPWYVSKNEVLQFINKNTKWINKHRQKVESQIAKFELDQTIQTKQHYIRILPIKEGKIRAVIKHHEVVITIPSNEDILSENVQIFIQKIIVEVCRIEAKEYLPQRVKELAQHFGFSYKKLFIKNLKSKWGSCSSLGNINLNLHLMRLPLHLIDYIILHELAHTKEMNHSPNFWVLLNQITNGEAKKLDKAIKNYNTLISASSF